MNSALRQLKHRVLTSRLARGGLIESSIVRPYFMASLPPPRSFRFYLFTAGWLC